VTVAEAQARALINLLAHYVTTHPGREVLLAVDEFSAVARRLPVWNLYERARSLGLAVQVSAQSWAGLAPDETGRNRIAAAAEGGVWLLRTAQPEPVTALAGQRRVVTTTRHLARFPRWRRSGTSTVEERPVADPALIRALDVGQAAYLYRGGVTYVQVSRLVAAPAALAPVPVPVSRPAATANATPATQDSAGHDAAPRIPGPPAAGDGDPGPPAANGTEPGADQLAPARAAGQSGADRATPDRTAPDPTFSDPTFSDPTARDPTAPEPGRRSGSVTPRLRNPALAAAPRLRSSDLAAAARLAGSDAPTAGPAAPSGAADRAAPRVPPGPEVAHSGQPTIAALLDAAFGPEPAAARPPAAKSRSSE
jgi:hypothetical protein